MPQEQPDTTVPRRSRKRKVESEKESSPTEVQARKKKRPVIELSSDLPVEESDDCESSSCSSVQEMVSSSMFVPMVVMSAGSLPAVLRNVMKDTYCARDV